MLPKRALFILGTCFFMSGCGAHPPDIAEAWDHDIPGVKTAKNPDASVPGVVDPTKTEPEPPAPAAAQIEYEIKKRVYCDLRDAVHAVDYYDLLEQTASKSKKRDRSGRIMVGLPPDWIAKVSLSLTVDETAALNPGVSLLTPMPNAITHFVGEGAPGSAALTSGATFPFLQTSQSYSFGLGGTLSSTATRVDKYNPTYTIKDLLHTPKYMVSKLCQAGYDAFDNAGVVPARSSPFLISESDLGITEWLLGSTLVNSLIPSSDDPIQEPEPEKTCKINKNKIGAVTPAYLACMRSRLAAMGYQSAEIMQIIAAKSPSAAPQSNGGGSEPKPDTISLEEKFVVVSSGNVTPSWKLVRVSANTGAPFFGAGRTRTHDLIITIGPANQATQDAHNTLVGPSATATANRAGTQ